jgi:hypothetical protein
VVPAIDLDNKPATEADKVEVVAEERSLAPEVVPFRSQLLEPGPEIHLHLGHIGA